jgi:hypothetical protein
MRFCDACFQLSLAGLPKPNDASTDPNMGDLMKCGRNILDALRPHFLLCLTVLVVLTNSALTNAQGLSAPVQIYLDQGWSEDQRQQFYTISQGSQLMPLNWFLALERPSSEDLFLADDLSRFGYLPNVRGRLNPNGLPVGFAEDEKGGRWVGLTCAACHTNQVDYRGTTLRIDGGPTDADLFAFLTEVSMSLQATLGDDAKFKRFALKVAGSDVRAQRDLRFQLIRYTAYFSTFVQASTPDAPWGPARADAFGMIFNRVSAIDLSDEAIWAWFEPLEKNNRATDAPVSYPFLWGTSRLDFVQWNAVAPNTRKYERLERNIVEVIGVFARINLRNPNGTLTHGYTSSVNVGNQIFIEENLIRLLQSPQWPESLLGTIDKSKAAKGASLYTRNCVSCHALTERNSTSPVSVKRVPVENVGTDSTMTVNVACRTSDTGILAGSREPIGVGHKLEQLDSTLSLAANVGVGVLETWLFSKEALSTQATAAKNPTVSILGKTQTLAQTIPVPFQIATGPSGNCDAKHEFYKAAPLRGIWATAPYFHNGSVPSLYQLLLPSGQRVAQFQVGTREFDPINVGFDISLGTFHFDTRIPGNGNKGHNYGALLTDDERWQLVEYLKTL